MLYAKHEVQLEIVPEQVKQDGSQLSHLSPINKVPLGQEDTHFELLYR